MPDCEINVARDFSEFPSGRFPADDEFCGEAFRENFLRSSLLTCEKITVVLDGTNGYPSSFLDEAFGGLLRQGILTVDEFRDRFIFVAESSEFKRYIDIIDKIVNKASQEQNV